jgi:Uri superfamily endonuclease
VGSARRGRDARVARHRRPDKPLRWHADYLFTRHPATRAWLLDTPLSECELAALLRAAVADGAAPAPDPAPRFGASDCGCAGHLVSTAGLGALRAGLGAAAARGGTLRALPVERRKRE